MAQQVQLRRGTAAENNAFTGALAEVTVNTTDSTLRVHDGVTVGGATIVGLTATQTLTNKTLTSPVLTTPNIGVATGTSVSVTGNITGSFFLGNGSQLTGIDATSIQNGTSNARVVSSGGNVTISVGGTSNVAVFSTGGVNVTANVTGGNILTGGLISATGNITGGNVLGGANVNATTHTGTTVSVTGNITGGNLNAAGLSLSSNVVSALNVTANIAGGNITTPGLISATGNITAANLIVNGTAAAGSAVLIVSGNIQTTTANNTANIGNVTNYFNTVHAKATTAQYADLAEWYTSDAAYPPGTVMTFGGDQEVTISTVIGDPRVAGVVSTNPAHIMNSGLKAPNVTTVALAGRVPTQVVGTVNKGDMMVSAGGGRAMSCATPTMGSVIGKALQDHPGGSGMIEIVVGRL